MTGPFNAYDPLEERTKRYEEILAAVVAKEPYRSIAARYGISPARVGQIVKAGPPGLAGWTGKERDRSEGDAEATADVAVPGDEASA